MKFLELKKDEYYSSTTGTRLYKNIEDAYKDHVYDNEIVDVEIDSSEYTFKVEEGEESLVFTKEGNYLFFSKIYRFVLMGNFVDNIDDHGQYYLLKKLCRENHDITTHTLLYRSDNEYENDTYENNYILIKDGYHLSVSFDDFFGSLTKYECIDN